MKGIGGSEVEVKVDIVEGFAEDPEAEAEAEVAAAVLAFWAGPIT